MNLVRETRKQSKLAQQDLAVRARISPGTLVAIERYGYRPTVEVRERIARALGCTADYLWPEEGMNEDSADV